MDGTVRPTFFPQKTPFFMRAFRGKNVQSILSQILMTQVFEHSLKINALRSLRRCVTPFSEHSRKLRFHTLF